jgi:hypothetical protein
MVRCDRKCMMDITNWTEDLEGGGSVMYGGIGSPESALWNFSRAVGYPAGLRTKDSLSVCPKLASARFVRRAYGARAAKSCRSDENIKFYWIIKKTTRRDIALIQRLTQLSAFKDQSQQTQSRSLINDHVMKTWGEWRYSSVLDGDETSAPSSGRFTPPG